MLDPLSSLPFSLPVQPLLYLCTTQFHSAGGRGGGGKSQDQQGEPPEEAREKETVTPHTWQPAAQGPPQEKLAAQKCLVL